MKRRHLALLLLGVACHSPADETGGSGPPGDLQLALERVVGGLSSPLYLTSPAGDNRLFVVEQPGRIRIVRSGQLLTQPFLDITAKVASGGERGLLSMAFHPDYAHNGFLYVDYTDRNGDTRVERYRVSADANVADAASSHQILFQAQPFANHNGGLVRFGPDGRFYIGLGDGGSAGDPQGNGQNRNTLLGKILRIDVDGADPYAIPADNPFVHATGTRPEIWAYGLRNPWRYAFDATGEQLYIADVGQADWEEVDIAPASTGGLNYGWNTMEGRHCYNRSQCDDISLTLPYLEYDHGQGCSITGGVVYRGQAIPRLAGHYLYSDYCSGFLRSFRFVSGALLDRTDWNLPIPNGVLSFGQDAAGEVYVMTGGGDVFRIVSR